jgi:hypothetical protein
MRAATGGRSWWGGEAEKFYMKTSRQQGLH